MWNIETFQLNQWEEFFFFLIFCLEKFSQNFFVLFYPHQIHLWLSGCLNELFLDGGWA